jgi:hypothetical protein
LDLDAFDRHRQIRPANPFTWSGEDIAPPRDVRNDLDLRPRGLCAGARFIDRLVDRYDALEPKLRIE